MLDHLYNFFFFFFEVLKNCRALSWLEHQITFKKEREQMEHLAFVVRHHSHVCPKAHRSHRLELSRNPEQELDTSNIYGQFIIDVPI